MQIVIDIPEDVYTRLFDNERPMDIADGIVIDRAIRKGIPLPKGHGRLKDMGNLKYVFDLTIENPIYSGKDIEWAIKSMTTIIEADKEDRK